MEPRELWGAIPVVGSLRGTEGSNPLPSRGESKTNPPRLRTRISWSRGVRTRPGYRPLYPLDLVYNNGSPPAPAPRKSGPTQAIVFPIPAEPIPAERQARQRREEEGFHRFAPEKPKPPSCLPAGWCQHSYGNPVERESPRVLCGHS